MKVCGSLLLGLFSLSIISASSAYLPTQLLQNTPNKQQSDENIWDNEREAQASEELELEESDRNDRKDEDRIDDANVYDDGSQPFEINLPDHTQVNVD